MLKSIRSAAGIGVSSSSSSSNALGGGLAMESGGVGGGSGGLATGPGSSRDWSSHSKLSRLFKSDSSVPLPRKIKTLVTFYAEAPRQEVLQFNRDGYALVYKLLLDTLQHCNALHLAGQLSSSGGGGGGGFEREERSDLDKLLHAASLAELGASSSSIDWTAGVDLDLVKVVLGMLKKLMEDVPAVFRSKWQARSIKNLLLQLLLQHNHFAIRSRGLTLLLHYIDLFAPSAMQSPGAHDPSMPSAVSSSSAAMLVSELSLLLRDVVDLRPFALLDAGPLGGHQGAGLASHGASSHSSRATLEWHDHLSRGMLTCSEGPLAPQVAFPFLAETKVPNVQEAFNCNMHLFDAMLNWVLQRPAAMAMSVTSGVDGVAGAANSAAAIAAAQRRARCAHFRFWLNILKEGIFTYLYPSVSEKMGYSNVATAPAPGPAGAAAAAAANEVSVSQPGGGGGHGDPSAGDEAPSAPAPRCIGFRPMCPLALHVLVVTWLLKAFESPTHAALGSSSSAAGARAREHKDLGAGAGAFAPPASSSAAAAATAQSSSSTLLSELCNDAATLSLVLEIFRQSFIQLPVRYSPIIQDILQLYSHWVRGAHLTPLLFAQMQPMLQTMMDHVFPAFCLLSSSSSSSGAAGEEGLNGGNHAGDDDQMQWMHGSAAAGGYLQSSHEYRAQLKQCGLVIRFYTLVAEEPFAILNEHSWEHLLVTLLNASNYLVRMGDFNDTSSTAPSGTTASGATSGAAEEEAAINSMEHLINPLLDCLFSCYLRSCISSASTSNSGTDQQSDAAAAAEAAVNAATQAAVGGVSSLSGLGVSSASIGVLPMKGEMESKIRSWLHTSAQGSNSGSSLAVISNWKRKLLALTQQLLDVLAAVTSEESIARPRSAAAFTGSIVGGQSAAAAEVLNPVVHGHRVGSIFAINTNQLAAPVSQKALQQQAGEAGSAMFSSHHSHGRSASSVAREGEQPAPGDDDYDPAFDSRSVSRVGSIANFSDPHARGQRDSRWGIDGAQGYSHSLSSMALPRTVREEGQGLEDAHGAGDEGFLTSSSPASASPPIMGRMRSGASIAAPPPPFIAPLPAAVSAPASVASTASSTSSNSAPSLNADASVLRGLAHFPDSFRTWLHFLRLIGPPHLITDAPARRVAWKGVVEALLLLIEVVQKPIPSKKQLLQAAAAAASQAGGSAKDAAAAVQHLDLQRKYLAQGRTLLHIFGPLLFEACYDSSLPESVSAMLLSSSASNSGRNSPSLATAAVSGGGAAVTSTFGTVQHGKPNQQLARSVFSAVSGHDSNGVRAMAIAALARIFCTRTSAPLQPEFISAFSFHLRQGLASGAAHIEWTLLRQCRTLFCMEHLVPASYVLLRDFAAAVANWSTPTLLLQREGFAVQSKESAKRKPGAPTSLTMSPRRRGATASMSGPPSAATSGTLRNRRRVEPPLEVRMACLSMLFSWISLPYAYETRKIVTLPPLSGAVATDAPAPLDLGQANSAPSITSSKSLAVAGLPRPQLGGGESAGVLGAAGASAQEDDEDSALMLSSMLSRSRSTGVVLEPPPVTVPAASAAALPTDVSSRDGTVTPPMRPSSPAPRGQAPRPVAPLDTLTSTVLSSVAATPSIGSTFSGSYSTFASLKSDLLFLFGRTLAFESLAADNNNIQLRLGALWALFVVVMEELTSAKQKAHTKALLTDAASASSPSPSPSLSGSHSVSHVVCFCLQHVLTSIRPPVLPPPMNGSLHHSPQSILTPELSTFVASVAAQAIASLQVLASASFQADELAQLPWVDASATASQPAGTGGVNLSQLLAKILQGSAASAVLFSDGSSSDSGTATPESSEAPAAAAAASSGDETGSVCETVLECLCALGESMLANMADIIMPVPVPGTAASSKSANATTAATQGASTAAQQGGIGVPSSASFSNIGAGSTSNSSSAGTVGGAGSSSSTASSRVGMGLGGMGIGSMGLMSPRIARPHASPAQSPSGSERVASSSHRRLESLSPLVSAGLMPALVTPLRREYLEALYAKILPELLHTVLEWICNSVAVQQILFGSSAEDSEPSKTSRAAQRTKARVFRFLHSCLNCHNDALQRMRALCIKHMALMALAGQESASATGSPSRQAAVSPPPAGAADSAGSSSGVNSPPSPLHGRNKSGGLASFGAELAHLNDAERTALLSPAVEGLALPGLYVSAAAQVSDAAHIVLKHVLNRIHHFPMALPSSLDDSDDEEEAEEGGAEDESDEREEEPPAAPGALVVTNISEDNDPLFAGHDWQLLRVELRILRSGEVLVRLRSHRSRSAKDEQDSAVAEDTTSSTALGTPRLHFVFDDSVLLTAVERPAPSLGPGMPAGAPTCLRLIARDLTGKYVWDLQLLDADSAEAFHARAKQVRAFLGQQAVQSSPLTEMHLAPELLLEAAARAQEHRFRALEEAWLSKLPLTLAPPRVSDTTCSPPTATRHRGTRLELPAPARAGLNGVSQPSSPLPHLVELDDEHEAALASASASDSIPAPSSSPLPERATSPDVRRSPDAAATAAVASAVFSVSADADPLEQVLSFVEASFPAPALLASETNQLEEARSAHKQRLQQAESERKATQDATTAAIAAATSSMAGKLRSPKFSVTSTPASSVGGAHASSAALMSESGFVPSAATSPRIDRTLVDDGDGEGGQSVRLCLMSSVMFDESAFGPVLPGPGHGQTTSGHVHGSAGANSAERKLRRLQPAGYDSISEEVDVAAGAACLGTSAQDSIATLYAPPVRQPISPFDYARTLLSRIYVGLDQMPSVQQSAPTAVSQRDAIPSLRSPTLVVLEDSTKLRRSLKLLDGNPARECHKIGVIYCGPAQDSQKALLANDAGSPLYESFLAALGSVVSTARHAGFLGGLDARSTGSRSLYWSSSSMEIMWHVVTLMPSRAPEVDEQQIHIKRQVGNDHVHVVWSEYGRDYRPSTISSQFNDAHIVIYPMRKTAAVDDAEALGPLPADLSSGLYRIGIFTKPSVPPFGPLQDGMVVRGAVLGALVRLTALNANRAIRYATAGYGRPLPTRRNYIQDILNKHAPAAAQGQASGGHDKAAAALSALLMPMLAPASSKV